MTTTSRLTRIRGQNCQYFVMNRESDSLFSACERTFITWNIFCNVLFEFHDNNGGCMNGHCHSFDINPNLTYSGWLVSIGNGEETHWHYTVHEVLLFIEELLLVVELWQALDCTDPMIIHHHETDLHRPYLNIYERRELIEKLEELFDWKMPKKLQSCIHMFLLKNQNRPDFQLRWANFISQIQECAVLSPELITTHILLLEWGVSK